MRFVTPHLLKRAATGVSLACLAASAAPFATASNTAASSSSGGKTCDAPGTIASAFVRPPATVNGGATPSFRLDMSTTTSGSSSSSSSSLNLDNIMLQRVTSEAGALGAPIKAGSLWAPHGAVVFVVRRPGCVLCREEAMDLSTKLLPQLKKAGAKPRPKLVAVVAETTSVDGFLEAFGEKGGETQTYLDAERGFQVALGDRWLGLQGLLFPSVWKAGKRAQTKYPELEGDLKGEGRRLGGLLVVDSKGQVQYSYLEKVFGDHAPTEEVMAAVQKL